MTTTSPKTIIKANISISSRFKRSFSIAFIIYAVISGISAYTITYFATSESDRMEDFWISFIILFLIMFVPVFGIVIMVYGSVLYTAKRCLLVLTDKGLYGQRKMLFGTIQVQLPMGKIDNIMVIQNLETKIFGGKTVSIRSVSGVVSFPRFQNADEFVKFTLAEIEKYNQSLKNVDQNLVSAIAGNSVQKAQPEKSSAQKIKDLKELLDSGLITQDEFDAKKKDLLDKM